MNRRDLISKWFATMILIVVFNTNAHTQAPGNAISLNGSSQYVSVPDNNALDLTNNFTVEAWIKPNSFNALGGIVTKYNSASSNGFTFTLGGTAPFTSIGFCGQGTATGLLTAGKWYHVAGVVSAGQVTIYINGISVKTGTAGPLAANSDAMTIGRDYSPTPRYLNGSIDEVRIWNDVRTQAEIQARMFTELTPANEANLVAYYNCNESSGTTLTDSKNSYNGTVSGSPSWPYSYAWMGGAYTVNPAGTGHDNFTTFANSVTALNAAKLSGSVTLNVKDDATFTETATQTITATGTAAQSITFQRSNDGTNKPKLQFTGTNGTTDACIQLNSSDYMTFNGLEIQPNGTAGSNFAEYGIFLNATGATDGCQYNTIKNCDIMFGGGGTANTASTTGIYLDNIATSAAGANSYNHFYSNKIDKATHGYLLLGTSGYNDIDNRISIIDGGTASLTDLGYGGNASATYGIEYQYQTTVYISYQLISFRSASITAATSYIAGIHSMGGTTVNTGMIYNNTISGLTANDIVPVSGICLEANSDCSIFNNTIQGIVNQTTGSNLVCGIRVNYGSCKIYNNMISQLSAPAIPARAVSGIELSSGTSNPMVYYNTVYLDYTSTNASNQSAALYTAHTGSLDLRNNIFINKSVMTTGTRAVAFYASATGPPVLTTTSNNNLYYAGTPSAKNSIFYNGFTLQTLADYQALWSSSPKREQTSVTESNTPFTSLTGTYNLHIPDGSSTLAGAGGGVITEYATDFDVSVRNATTPDIGADEFLTPRITISPASLAFGTMDAGNTSASQPYTLNGLDLSASATITAPDQYQVSLDNSTFSTSLTVPVTNTNTGSKVVYVRFSPVAAGTFNSNVTNVSGALTVNIPVTGAANEPGCTQSSAATGLLFGNITNNSIGISGFTAATGATGYVIYVNNTNTFTPPANGQNPTVNTIWANAGQQAIYNANSIPSGFNVTGLFQFTTYYFKVYAYKICTTLKNFESTGLSGSAATIQAPVFVKYDATGMANGTSWDDAYTSLQYALDANTNGAQIWVARGHYYPSKTSWGSTTPYDPKQKTFFLNKNVSIYGGFAGTETSLTQRTDYGNGGANETILDGNISDQALATDNIYQVITIPVSASPNLNGLSVKNGFSQYFNGGGITFEGVNYSGSNNSVISNCYFSNNTAQNGSAVYMGCYNDNAKCYAQFSNCLFESNITYNGVSGNGYGTIYLKAEKQTNGTSETSPVFTNCIIRGNTTARGGGLFLTSNGGTCNPIFYDCAITENLSKGGGGVIVWKVSGTLTPTFVNSIITSNADNSFTGGLYFITPCALVLNNCIIWNNKTGSQTGTAAANISGSGYTANNSLLQGYNIGGTNLDGITNKANSNYPGFSAPLNMSTATLPSTSGDFHLTDFTPVINAGNPDYLNLPPTQFADLDGEERLQAGGLDLGPYEGGMPCVTPVIDVQPGAAARFEGETNVFTIGATGSNLVYQWRKNGTNLTNGSSITGATTASLTLTDLVLSDAGTYSCYVTGSCGTATSNGAMLTVDALCVNPVITAQPSGAALKLNESITFSVLATGTNLMYQWKKGGVNISGANNASYTIGSLAYSDASTYTCYISNACNNVTSSDAVLTVSKADQTITFNAFGAAAYGDPDITPDATASSNLILSFASSNTAVATIINNQVHIAGVGTSTITASQAGDGNYNPVANATQFLTVDKGTVTLTLDNLLQAHDGSAKSVTVTTDPPDLTTVVVNYEGSSTEPSAIGSYAVVATLNNSLYQGTATGTMEITCNPVMAEQLQSNFYIPEGQSFSITANVVGSPAIGYQWKKDGADISLATSATYTIPSLSATDRGIYTCYISNGCGNVTTNDATLTVSLAAPTSAIASPSTINSGGSSILSAISAGNQIRWYNDPEQGYSLGTVESGAGFSVSPKKTTTYYAMAIHNGVANLYPSETRTAVTVTVSNFTYPSAQPTNLNFSNTKTGSDYNIVVNYTASASADGYVVVRKAGSAPTFVPANGTTYSAGTQGSDQIVYAGSAVTCTDAALSIATTYYYAIYAFKGSGSSIAYLTANPLSGNSTLYTTASGAIAGSGSNSASAGFPNAGANITFPGGTTGTTLTVTKTAASPVSNFSVLPGVKGVKNMYFTITSTNATPGTYTLVMDFSDLGLTQSQWTSFKVLKRTDATSVWVDVTATGGTIVSRQTDGVWGKFTISGLSSFSEFALGEPFDGVIVSNLNESIIAAIEGNTSKVNAQAFTTNATRYDLTWVTLSIWNADDPSNATLKLYGALPTGEIDLAGGILVTFGPPTPGPLVSGNYNSMFFPSSPASYTLQANTTYWLVFSSSSITDFNTTLSSGYSGAGILPATNNNAQSDDGGITYTYYNDQPFVVAVNGNIIPTQFTWDGSEGTDWNTAANWSNNSVPAAGDDVIIANVANDPLVTITNAACNNLTLESGAVLTIQPGKVLTVNGTVTNSAGATGLVIKSDATGDGTYIGPSTQATVERYIPKNGWHLVSSPVAGATNALFTGMYMKQYNETADAFGNLVTATNVALTPGTGSSLWSTTDKTLTFTGTINAGPVAPSTPKAGNGFTLAGNPFTAPIDWNAASGWTKTNIAASTWIWNGTQYAVWNGATGTNNATQYIAMGQGFFVQATPGGAALSISESARNGQQVSPLFRSAKAQPELLRLTVNGNGLSDEAVVMIAADALATTDYRYDALKMPGSADAPQIAAIKDGKSFTIASLSSVDSTTVIPVTLKTGATGTYTLNLANTINTGGLNTFLVDKISGTATRTDLQPVYSFTSSPSDIAGRFEIVFRSQSVITAVQKSGEFRGDIKIWNSGRKLNIDIPSNEELVNVEIYSLNGIKVKSITSGSLRDIDLNLNTGMYVVRVKTTKQVKTNKIVLY